MKKNLHSRILKIMIFFSLFIILCISNTFLLESKAKEYTNEEISEYIDQYKDVATLQGDKLIDKLNEIGIDEIKKTYKKLEDDSFREGIQKASAGGTVGNPYYDNVKKKLGFYISEVDRVKQYNQTYIGINAIKTEDYDMSEINRLKDWRDEIKKSLKKNNSKEEQIEYSANYYQNVIDNLGGIIGQEFTNNKDFKIDKKLNTNNTPTDILTKKINEKIDEIAKYINKPKIEEDVIASSGINPDDYDPSKNPLTVEESKEVTSKVGIILGAIRNISVVTAVIIVMIIGLKYILGSVEEKANYKTTMLPYIIGCVMAVAGTTIVSFIYNSMN